jgi:molybdopterin-guanine dinucleotide biosynthesis protein A
VTSSENHKKAKGKTAKYLLNPYEIAVCGSYSFYKNNFVQFLYYQFSEDFEVCNVDYPTFETAENEPDFILEKTLYVNFDFVLINSQNNLDIPKILFINPDDSIEDIKETKFTNIIAYAGTKDRPLWLPADIPFFHVDDTENVKSFILGYFKQMEENIPFYGLVLTGGKSSRMQTDKALLKYQNKPQAEVLIDLLNPVCDKVFISTREMNNLFSGENLGQIPDKFLDLGPIGGIISAMDKYPEAAWLVIACDLPFVDADTISYLIKNRDPFKIATAYRSSTDNFPEPLCTIFEPKSRFRLFQFLGLGYECPRKVLINSKIKLLEQVNKLSLTNVNYPEEYQNALKFFRGKKER